MTTRLRKAVQVLVADDHLMTSQVMGRLLQLSGFVVQTAGTFTQSTRMCEQSNSICRSRKLTLKTEAVWT